MTPNDALLHVIAELRIDVDERDVLLTKLRAKNEELHAECARLQTEVVTLTEKANQ